MNRKSTVIVFTLEDEIGTVLGKKLLHFKVCSCPKRDKEKDEASLVTEQQPKPKKRKPSEAAVNFPSTSQKRASKFIMLKPKEEILTPSESDDNGLRSVSPQVPPTLNSDSDNEEVRMEIVMPNMKTMMHVVKCAYNAISGEMTVSNNPQALLPYLKKLKQMEGELLF